KQEEKRIEEEQAAKAQYWNILACCDDDDDYNSAITPVLSNHKTQTIQHQDKIEDCKPSQLHRVYSVIVDVDCSGFRSVVIKGLTNSFELTSQLDSPSISANSSHNPPHIDERCYECGDALDGIFCQRCACKSCGKGAHIGYNCPPKVSIISNPEPCNQTMNNEPPQTLPSFNPMCYSEKEIHHLAFHNLTQLRNPLTFSTHLHNLLYTLVNFAGAMLNMVTTCEGPHETFQYQQVISYEPCCENCGGPHKNFQCQPLNYYEPNRSYDSNYFGFDQFGDFHPQQDLCCDNYEGLHEASQCQPMNQNFYNSNSLGFDQTQPLQFPVIHQPPQETSIEILHDQEKVINSVQTFLRKFNRYSFFETPKVLLLAWDRVFKIKDTFGNEQYKPEDVQELSHKLLNDMQNIHEELAEYINTPGWNRHAFYNNGDDDDVDYTIAITPVLSNEEPDNSLSMRDEHLDTIPATESDKVIKSSVKDLVSIPSESKALKDNPTPSSEFLTKSSSTYLKPFLEGTDTFDNSLLEFENFCFDLEEISSGSTTTHSDISLLDYEAFSVYDDHIEEISSGSTTTQSDISLPEYDSFIFDLSNDQFPPTDRSDFTHEEFGDEPAHIISPSEYDCFYFRNFPDPGEWISSLNSGIRENLSSTTCVNLPVEDDHSPLLAYVVWIFLAYFTYPVIPPHLYSFENEDTIFDPGITINRFYSSKPGVSHRCRTFKKFNTHRSHLNESPMEMLFSTLFLMDQ
nr:hypothetical protein [Tanacetum cinerariifolium]